MIRLFLGVASAISMSCCYAQSPLLAQQSIPDLPPSYSISDDEKKEESSTLTEARLRELRKKRARNYVLTGTLMFLSGAADGLNQALQFRYDGFKKMFPNSCDQFWDPRKSGANKYKNGRPEQGRKFPGSKTWLVFVTDGYHLTRFINHFFMSGAVGVKIAGYEKKKWHKFLLECIGYWVVNRVGFSLVYNRF